MKALPIVSAIALSLAVAMPVAAHHMCDELTESCPDEIGDEQAIHDDSVERLDGMQDDIDLETGLNNQENLDPADSIGGPDAWEEDYSGAGPLYQGVTD